MRALAAAGALLACAAAPLARAADGGGWSLAPAGSARPSPYAEGAPGDRSGAVVARGGGRDARVPLRLRVAGPAPAAPTVERVRLDADAERITYELVNRGTTVLAPRVAVRADGVFGELLDRAPHRVPARIAPGGRVALSEPWPGVPWPAAVGAGAGAVAAVVAAWCAVRHVVRRWRRGTAPLAEPTAAAEREPMATRTGGEP
ncbi:hypothetical protein ACIG3E_12925 [Streptomyces sp. NPDC053474]|uniref:hypothetical protein n=1 Tax=Streptomyces sp. NPDC053474 TaxID=3365704 RepID=UPI0037D97416